MLTFTEWVFVPALDDPGQIREYRAREGDELPVYCGKKDVGGDTKEIAMELPVELPLFVPAK